ncbi:MAG: geranylgeranyl reductase family protein [Chloroflexi bacterium]|nr:geranylgeranyl reductase family protein [Chloroflexota bacterium]
MNSDWDVIVVGAGPGGSSAAYGLAKAGLRVLLLEKEKIPRYKACGGGLTAKVRAALDFDFSPTIEDTIHQASVAFGPERTRIGATAWCVMRDKFDALLAARAASAGAELRDAQPVSRVSFENGSVQVESRSGAERAKFVIGADGVNGIVRRAAGFPAHQRMAAALEAEMDAPTAALDEWHGALHLDFGAIAWGYAWIFPKAEHLSVGIGDLFRIGGRADLRAALQRYVASEPSLHDAKTRFTRGHRVPLGGEFATYHVPRAVLVGDAAGLVDPFTAEGIYYAIRSGQIAAEEVGRAFARGDFDLVEYTRRINREINSDFRYAWALTQVFYRMPHLAYRIFARSAGTQSAVTDVAEGGLTYLQMLGRVAQSLVRSLVKR